MNASYQTYSDDELLKLMRLHDTESFEAIYRRYEEPLLSYAIRMIGSKEDAADIMQEIFVSLWNRREEIVFTHSLKAWLYQAVRFQAARYFHHHCRKNDLLQEIVDLVNVSEDSSAQLILEEQELAASLKHTIKRMPEKMREVFVLSRQYHLSHREISHKMNIAESTVKKQVQNALRFIREKSLIDFIVFIFVYSSFFLI